MMAGQAARADIEMAFLAIAPAGGKTGNQQVVVVMSTCDGTSTPAKRAFIFYASTTLQPGAARDSSYSLALLRRAQRMSMSMTVCGMLNWLDTASIDISRCITTIATASASLIGWRVPWIAVRLVCLPHNRSHGFPMLLVRSTSPIDYLSNK
ncbi:hypothetical protein I6F14_24095 [Bradyrhizobium sp. IC3069]|uniref:hypothetical protein n=2 Tax=unclassified Bradyrhizobium TaxID=2631580 RepID=UPI001CD2A33D|nr:MULTISPECIES: hypothetical protein [unclassified Bradyrhizobium]MCA1363478.1 hypothetical protein [Bradyrhizobium sp. IC4059]MCA1521017.1 hypothetical protein [Bradyrhizobium sp. IC3069]